MNDPFVGQLDVLPRLLGDARVRHGRLQLDAARRRSGSGACSGCTPNKREEIESASTRATSRAVVGLKNTRTGDTLCDPSTARSCSSRWTSRSPSSRWPSSRRPRPTRRSWACPWAGSPSRTRRSGSPWTPRPARRSSRGHGRAPPRDHRRPAAARVQGRGQRRAAAGRLPRDDPPARPRPEGRFVRQTGGRGQYGDVVARDRAARAGHGLRLREQDRRAAAIPREYIPAVEKGVQEALETGVLAGYPVVDVQGDADRRLLPRGRLVRDGVQDRRLDGVQGRGAARPSPVLLEPVMDVEVVTPEEYHGRRVGDLEQSRRGKIAAMEARASAPGHPRQCAARPDVRVRDRSALR